MSESELPPEDDAPKLSREELREEADAYRELAVSLSKGKPAVLPDPPFAGELRAAVLETRGIAMKARPRQLRRLAQVLRSVSLEELREALEGNTAEAWADRDRERAMEAWRTRLLQGGDAALSEFVVEHPDTDRTRLRQLIRQASKSPPDGRSKKASTTLLRFVRDAHGGSPADAPDESVD